MTEWNAEAIASILAEIYNRENDLQVELTKGEANERGQEGLFGTQKQGAWL